MARSNQVDIWKSCTAALSLELHGQHSDEVRLKSGNQKLPERQVPDTFPDPQSPPVAGVEPGAGWVEVSPDRAPVRAPSDRHSADWYFAAKSLLIVKGVSEGDFSLTFYSVYLFKYGSM